MSRNASLFRYWVACGLAATFALVAGCGPSTPSKETKPGTSPEGNLAAPEQKPEEDSDIPLPPMKPGEKPEPSKPETKFDPSLVPSDLNPPEKPATKTETPKTDEAPPAKVDLPKIDEKPPAKADLPKIDEPLPPKATLPKIDEKPPAKVDLPKIEKETLPKVDAPKTQTGAKPLSSAALLATLPAHCNTPDGMTLMPDQSVIVSMPNFNDKSDAPLLVKITADNQVQDFFKLPPNPDTGRMGPMGIRVAPSGDLYLADNQLFHHKDGKTFLYGKSRLVRIAMKDGKPTKVAPVATALNVANGVALYKGYVYLTESILVPDSKPLVSGVFRFKFGDEGIAMKQPLADDPHLVVTLEGKQPFGADGICFDGQGRLYVSSFTDGVIYRVLLDENGKATSKTLFAKADFMRSCDGMDYDPKTDKIYSADLLGNAIRVFDMEGHVQTLAADSSNDGAGGRLRAPCEALVRGNTIVVSNMDFPVEGGVITKFSKPATMSVIKLD